MKKILLISPYFPYPPNNGGKVRIYNLIKHLALKNEVYLLSYIDSPEAKKYIPDMKKICKEVYAVFRDQDKRIVRENLPRSISFFYTPEMIAELERVIAEIKPDIVQIDFLIMTQYVNHIKNIPVIYTEHDISNINFEQSFHDRDLDEKMRFVEWNRLVKFEKEILPKFHTVIVLTERDKNILHDFMPGIKSILIPTGVDVSYFQAVKHETDCKFVNLLYVGHYRHYPNYDAVKYFVDDIFPIILAKLPNAKFFIAGSGTYKNVLDLQGENIIVTGEVDDVRECFKTATVFVAPIRLGGGIKGKILEAMASGVPVVATNEAGAGIECTNNEDIVIAQNNSDFALKIIELVKDKEKHSKIAENAEKLVSQLYDWHIISDKLNIFYNSL